MEGKNFEPKMPEEASLQGIILGDAEQHQSFSDTDRDIPAPLDEIPPTEGVIAAARERRSDRIPGQRFDRSVTRGRRSTD